MKKLIILLAYLYLLFPIVLVSEDNPTMCPMDMSQFPQDTIPNYLQPWWNNVQIGLFAVVFVDFPDGRYINGNDTLQAIYDWQLEWVRDHGVLDAAGEMGLILEQTNIQVGNKFVKASKYNWYDRWNMFFDSVGVYYGAAHPDFVSHGDSAFGSFKQYWKEASNGKFELIPYVTHPSETNYKFKTGIVNNYQMINGNPVIKCLKMPRKKYGNSDLNSYWRTDSTLNESTENLLVADVIAAINNQIDTENFNLQEFLNNKGILFVYFAGSHRAFKDATTHNQISPIRLREGVITDTNSVIDGFGVSAHQYGHLQFGWSHTNSGRCDIMNGGDVHDNNSPQFPNPIYRMKQGWLQPIALEPTQEITDLEPIETSYQCVVITIYGKPSAASDWSTGECYVVENRRRLGFDRKIVEKGILNQFYPNFKGGLLVWHYSPYYRLLNPYALGENDEIRLRHNDTTRNLTQNRGNPKTFFAWDQGLPPIPSDFYNLDSSKTKSGSGLQTGIKISDITQLDYGSLNSGIQFHLNYLISEPTQYDGVVYYKDYNAHLINYSGKVFYHEYDPVGYFGFEPGTILEHHGTDNGNNPFFKFNSIEAKGSEIYPVMFRGLGFTSVKTKHFGLDFKGLTSHLSIDSLILNNVQIENVETSKTSLTIGYATGVINSIPVELNNIDMAETTSANEIALLNSTVSKINLKDKRIAILNKINFNGDLNLENGKINFANSICSFKDNCGINTLNTIIGGNTDSFNVQDGYRNWNGIASDGGSLDLRSSIIRNAFIGIYITGATGNIIIKNSKFENNRDYDISIYKTSNESDEKPRISKNVFSQEDNTNVKIASIIVNECPNIDIDTNTITNTGYFGIILMNVESPLINNNSITGGNLSETRSSGIFSYNSNGYYKCNAVSQCMNYGILLDNSQPVLFNNEIFVNGIGLYLTNNSNPIMTSAYLNNETYVIGGYNDIHNNAGKEIYCNNSKINNSVPVMQKGYNSVEDSIGFLPDTLIYNKVSSSTPHIDAIGNYWGGSSPTGRLIPDNSFTYDPYLTSQFSHDCEYASEPADNTSMPIEYLLMGNVMKNQEQENFDIALNYSYQLIAIQNSEISPVISLNDLFTSSLLSNGNFINLENYYLSMISQNPEDSVINNKLLNLSIESKIARNELEDAISEYDEILNTNTDEEIIFYASIDRSRAIRLLLDSLLSHYQGDNSVQNIEQMYDNAINYETRINSSDKELNSEAQKEINAKGKDNKSMVKARDGNNFTFLKKSIAEKIRNFAHLSEKERRSLIVEKNILDLSVKNYVEGIASIKDKLQFLNQKTQEVPRTYKLYQNFPNPFNPVTQLEFGISKLGFVSLKVYDILGKEVKTLVNEIKPAGIYKVQFDGSNLPSGVYFYKIEAGDFLSIKKMMLIK